MRNPQPEALSTPLKFESRVDKARLIIQHSSSSSTTTTTTTTTANPLWPP